MLVAQPGRVITHRQLLREGWGPGHAEDVHYVRVHIGNLRKKIEADPAQPRWLQTEAGVGYRLLVGLGSSVEDTLLGNNAANSQEPFLMLAG